MKNSFPIYRNKRKDILAVITEKSTNRKIGDMAQVSVLVDSISPIEALQGKDSKICGDCPLRPSKQGGCYVTVARFAQAVWRSVKGLDAVTTWATTKPVRLGAYGDPAMLPIKLLAKLTQGRKHTGYTHQWRKVAPTYARYLMASIDKLSGNVDTQIKQAKAKGYRYFRVSDDGQDLRKGEILCPNYSHGVSCADCLLCDGSHGKKDKRKNIVIPVHGSSVKKYFNAQGIK
jgi:hypothetical protein